MLHNVQGPNTLIIIQHAGHMSKFFYRKHQWHIFLDFSCFCNANMYSRIADKLSKGSSENWDPFIYLPFKITTYLYTSILDAVARSEACSLGMQATPSSIPMSGTFFRGDLVMKRFLPPFSLSRWFKKSSCLLLAKECALSTGKLVNC